MKLLFLLLICFSGISKAGEWATVKVPAPSALAARSWLRCYFTVPDAMTSRAEKDLWSDSVTLSVGDISGPYSLWLNGQKIGEGTDQPARDRRRFKVPKGILEKQAFNTLAIYLENAAGGIGMPPILAGYFDELLFEGVWEIHSGELVPADLKPLAIAPNLAVYLESAFKPSTTPLSANQETMPGVKLPPAESLAKMTPANDLVVELMVSEPEVAQPTHISFDDRGRMWVAQYRQYPYPAGVKMISRDKYYRSRFDRVPVAPPHHDYGKDIISMHEDTDGDGKFDKHTNVLEGLNMANASLRGHGGLWVMHTPYLLFYPVKDGDTLGEPEVRLAGFGLEDTHSVANGLAWGPDGWIYGGQGSTTTSRVVRPGIDPPNFPGVFHESCMIWRYHPDKKIYEIFAQGGGNTFELDFDSEGRLLSGHNGGDTHGFHFMQDALMLKQGLDPGKFGAQSNPFSFGYLDAIKSQNPIARFTHATIMADGSAMPPRYAGRMLGADPLHRNVIVAERMARGSTFETRDVGVAVVSADISCRPVYITNAPDGGIYMADFYEEFIAHGQNYQGQLDPSTGRIYRLRGRDLPLNADVNLAVKSSLELVRILAHPNRWHRQTAVRVLGERRDASVVEELKLALGRVETHPALEALWALHQMDRLSESSALAALRHPQPSVRLWAIRLLGDARQLPQNFAFEVEKLATSDPDAEVRAQIACTAHRLSAAQGLPLVAALMKRGSDAVDPCIPLLCWWVLESHCTKDREAVLAALTWESALINEHILARLMRRFAATEARADLLTCANLLELAPTVEHRKLLMKGFEEAFKGRALPPLPESLVEVLTRGGLASSHLRVRLREPAALAAALTTLSDSEAKQEQRLLCVQLFGDVKFPEAVTPLLKLAVERHPPELRKAALTALLSYEDERIGREVSQGYAKFPPEVQSTAQTLLASRPTWSLALLKVIEAGDVPRNSLPPTTADLLRNHADERVATLAKQLLKAAAPVPQVRAEIERLTVIIRASPGDAYKGETIYLQRCAGCHTLFQKGGKIGPDLTSYQREDLGTLLPSIVAPSSEIREGFTAQVVSTTDGRTLSGFLSDQDTMAIVLRGLDGQNIHLPRKEIREMRALPTSLMPEGLLAGLSDQDLRDFFAYLRIPQPITR